MRQYPTACKFWYHLSIHLHQLSFIDYAIKTSAIRVHYLLLLPEHFVLQFICQSFVCRSAGIMVYVSLSTTTDVIGLVFRPGFMHCSLRDYIGVMCASRLGGFDLWGINVASTTTLCIAVSSGSPRDSRAVTGPAWPVVDVRPLNMLHHLGLQFALHGRFHRRRTCMKAVSQKANTSAE